MQDRGTPGPTSVEEPYRRPEWAAAVRSFLTRFPARRFARGEVVLPSTFEQPQSPTRPVSLAYIAEGLVRGVWCRARLAPDLHPTGMIAGDGGWVGTDAFKYGRTLLRYEALSDTFASLVPLDVLTQEAPAGVLCDVLQCVSLQWCTAAAIHSLASHSLYRRALLLLFDLRRVHPRPEIEVRQSDVADLLGVARQTLHPVLKALEAAGLVTLGYSEITVGDAAQLFSALVADEGLSSVPEGGGSPAPTR